MQHYVNLSVTCKFPDNVTKYSVVRFDGGYTDTSPILGVVLEDGSPWEYGAVAVRGILPVKIATGETVNVGDLLGLDEFGKGVAPSSSLKVSDFAYVYEISQGHALVII